MCKCSNQNLFFGKQNARWRGITRVTVRLAVECRLGNTVLAADEATSSVIPTSVPPGIRPPLRSHLGFLPHDDKESNKHIPGNLLLVPVED